MSTTWPTLLACSLVLASLGGGAQVEPAPRAEAAPSAAADPVALHRTFLDALDDMRIDDALACFARGTAVAPAAILVAVEGDPDREARSPDACRALLHDWAVEGMAATRTRIVKQRFEPLGPDLGYLLLAFERSWSSVASTTWRRSYRSVSIVRREEGAWRLLHWNVFALGGWAMDPR